MWAPPEGAESSRKLDASTRGVCTELRFFALERWQREDPER